MSFTSAVTSTNEDAIDTLFGTKVPGADNLLGAVKKQEEEEEEEVEKPKSGKLPAARQAAPVEQKSEEEEIGELFPGEDDTPVEGAKPKAVLPTKEKAKPVESNLEVDYETVYNQFVKDGVWGEVEIPDGTEWNAETFKKVQQLQTTTQYEDLLDKTGPYGKAIIQYEQDGGNPGELLSLFREQRTVQEFDISTKEGQEEFLTSYYGAQGNSEKSTARMIRALSDQGPEALREESAEKKELWDGQYKQEVDARLKEQTLQARQLEESARNFNKTINSALAADGEVPLRERRELSTYMLDYSQAYNGKEVSQFYVDMAEIQKDPKNYIELAKFIKGIKNGSYKKNLESKVTREVAAKTFMKVKNGNALSGGGGGTPDLNSDSGPNFATLLTRKS